MKKFNAFLDAIHTPAWLTLVLFLVLLARIPNLLEPYSYGDEMIYLTLGEGVRQGLTLYKDIHDNKPPLLYFLAAISGNLFWFRAMLVFWSLATVIAFWKLTKQLLQKNELAQRITTIIFAILTTLPLFEGNIANAENFMIGLTIFSFLAFFHKKYFLSGILLSLSLLFKVPAVFDFGVIAFYILALQKFDLKNHTKKIILIGLGIAAPVLLTFGWYFAKGAFPDYLKAAFLQNVGYLSSWRPDDVQKPFLEKNGPLLMRAGIAALGALILFIKRKNLSHAFIFASIWLITSLFAVTLSERPYPHYLLQSAGAVAILAGIFFTSQKKEQVLTLIPLLLFAFVPFYYRFYYYKTGFYYSRFAQFATGQINKDQYFAKFDGNVSRNYKIAEFVKNNSRVSDGLFVLGDSAPIYAMSGRLPPFKYIANYHISDFSSLTELGQALTAKKPLYIVILPQEKVFRELQTLLNKNYILISNIDSADIWKVKKL